MRRLLHLGLAAIFLLHNDWWLWADADRVLGLPKGLAYHVGYCVLVAAWMAAMVRWAWPAALDGEGEGER